MIEREERVTPLELFFDLVFVFAITDLNWTTDDAEGTPVRGLGARSAERSDD